jgi:hypothetical protein
VKIDRGCPARSTALQVGPDGQPSLGVRRAQLRRDAAAYLCDQVRVNRRNLGSPLTVAWPRGIIGRGGRSSILRQVCEPPQRRSAAPSIYTTPAVQLKAGNGS